VIVDRENGAQRELLAAPIPRTLLVLGNLLVALTVTALQIVALLGAAWARGVSFHIGSTGALWFLGTVLLFTIGMYGVSETLASRVPRQEEFIARVPPIAIVPWFLAGALFPITALPLALTWLAKFLPITHALALMRYGLLGDSSSLHTIWHSSNATAMAGLSFAVVAAFGALLTVVAVRVFGRSAVQ
jgi:ABC-2 type transport system permease protein